MRGQHDYLGGLAQLQLLDDLEQQRATWRQSMATLARAVEDNRAVPLEGFSPDALLAGVRAAFNADLIDDLDWLSPAAAAAALYELAAALPMGFERREIGRRVLKRLREGNAATFVSVATLLALGSPQALSGPQIRARVALSLDLPFGLGAQGDALALALISRRGLQQEWLTAPSIGSLPSRRLAARLLERAAREAARRAAAGDDTGVGIFATPTIRTAWDRLLADRESLVWRHVAVARGLLSVAMPTFGTEVDRHLDANLSPTEWRRAAASLAGAIAARPDDAVAKGHAMLTGQLMQLDRGVASAMILGLPRAAEVEPAAAEELLETLVRVGSVAAAESLVELRRERLGEDFGIWAAKLARTHLRAAGESIKGVDDGKSALVEALDAELRPEAEHAEPTLKDRLSRALDAFSTDGAAAAYEEARAALDAAQATMSFLEECNDADPHSRRWGFRALRELDVGLLETATLGDLLTLGTRPDEESTRALGALFERLSAWLIAREGDHVTSRDIPHLSVRMRRMRTMLHLVDSDGSYGGDSSGELRDRRLLMARVLLRRVRDDVHSPMRRTVTAAAARACDALVREDICEISDVVIAAGHHLKDEIDFVTLGEASMVPELEAVSYAYSRLAKTVAETSGEATDVDRCLEALIAVANDLPLASSRRVEALRAALRSFARQLLNLSQCISLRELSEGGDANLLARLEEAARALAQLMAGGLRRLRADESDEPAQCGAAIRLIDFGVERALRGAKAPLIEALKTASELLRDELPPAIAEVGCRVLANLKDLPIDARPGQRRRKARTAVPERPPLPPWLPPGRTIGGFYVLHALGSGAAASVFVVKRIEERSDPTADRLALKVPEYDGSAALTLSENQFLQLFREEASALLTIPQQENLARFVTFDAGARPKPILVMELVEGPTLERFISLADLSVERGLAILDGVAAGLEAMHAAGVGHLDIKPSNVILRTSGRNAEEGGEPVLVDLGLAGRNLRPGCGTPNYAAPEIWGAVPEGHHPTPTAADVYAFGCLAFEVLTGRLLFETPAVGELRSAHLGHDGGTPAIRELARHANLGRLAQTIAHAIRRDPRKRPPISTVRSELAELAPLLENLLWPLGGSEADTVPRLTMPIPLVVRKT